jgi:hypothetical protein
MSAVSSPRRVQREAHSRLEEKLDPLLGGSQYLIVKINEARDTLLRE